MAPSEMSYLREIGDLLAKHVADFRVFKTKLLGDDEEELSTGRIPTIEAVQRDHAKRLARLEALALKVAGGLGVITALGWVAELLYHAQGALKR